MFSSHMTARENAEPETDFNACRGKLNPRHGARLGCEAPAVDLDGTDPQQEACCPAQRLRDTDRRLNTVTRHENDVG